MKERKQLTKALSKETRELTTYLESVAEILSQTSGCAVFLSSPKFDQNCVIDIKIVAIDSHRCLTVLITDFGLIHTETVYTEGKLSNFTLKRVESFFHWKLTGLDKPSLPKEEEALATRLYGEVMMRYLVGAAHGIDTEITKTGFSKLLTFTDFNDAAALAEGLGIFENPQTLSSLLQECSKKGVISCWIGGPLQGCSAIAIPYRINQMIVGAIAFLGPHRIAYRKLFGILSAAAEAVSESLTKSLYKFKISYRIPNQEVPAIPFCLLLENKND